MINGQKVVDPPRNNDQIKCDKIQKITNGQGDDYTTGFLLNYPYFKEYDKLIAIDLSKQQALDTRLEKYCKLILLEI